MALWYFTRGTGVATLVLFSVTVALGIVNVKRITSPGFPRFVIDRIHRNASLLAVTFLAVSLVALLSMLTRGSLSLVAGGGLRRGRWRALAVSRSIPSPATSRCSRRRSTRTTRSTRRPG